MSLTALSGIVSAVSAIDKGVTLATNFEHMTLGTALPFLVLQSFMNQSYAAPGVLDNSAMRQHLIDSYNNVIKEYLPDETVVEVNPAVQNTGTDAEGNAVNETTVKLKTTDKELTSYVNIAELYKTICEGNIPTGNQIYLALLDIIDMLDLGVLGDYVTNARIETHLRERTITVTEKVSQYIEKEPDDIEELKYGETRITEQVTDTYEHTTTLGGEDLDTRTIQHVEAKNQLLNQQTVDHHKEKATPKFNKGTETIEVHNEVIRKESLKVERLDSDGNMREIQSNQNEVLLEESNHSTTIGTNQTVEESERTLWQKIIGTEVTTKVHTYVQSDEKFTVYRRAEDGTMKLEQEEATTEVLQNDTVSTTDWESGYITYVPFVGTGTDMIRKYRHGYKVTAADWAEFTFDGVSIGLLIIAPPLGAKAVAGKVGIKVATKALAKNVAKSAAKAVLKPKKALSNFFSHPGKVFSPERIAAKTLSKAHNPMKGDMLKVMAELHKIGSPAKIRHFLRKEFAHDPAIGRRLYKNYEYLRKNKCLTPDNLKRMADGKSPIIPGNPPEKLHLDHIAPKSTNPMMKADPVNLRFLKASENMARGNKLSRHDLTDLKEVLERYPNEPLTSAMHNGIAEVLQTTPGWQNSPFWLEVLNRPTVAG